MTMAYMPNVGLSSAATYLDIIALRPCWPAHSSPPPLPVCNRLRDMGLWAVCRLTLYRIGSEILVQKI